MDDVGNVRNMSRPKISGAIIARNEEENIMEAIESLSFADQIVVVDTGSFDKTMEIAERAGAEVHRIKFEGFGKTKNKALEFCKGEWVFFLDADERVPEDLAKSILRTAKGNLNTSGFMVNRLTYFLGKPVRHSGWHPDYVLRFFRRDKGKISTRLVHESVIVDGPVGNLDGLLIHYSYKSIEQYLDKLNEYSSLSAREMFASGKKFRFVDFIFRPVLLFLKMFLFKAGYLDGFNGFLLAVLSSYHVLIKYAKLRRLWNSNHENTK